MKKMTLDETWTNCLKMWRWIAKQRKLHSYRGVGLLKAAWLEKHKFGKMYIDSDCFFCEYVASRNDCGCKKCPGSKVDHDFDCQKPEYNYGYYPIEFYNKLVALNKIRLKRKGKK